MSDVLDLIYPAESHNSQSSILRDRGTYWITPGSNKHPFWSCLIYRKPLLLLLLLWLFLLTLSFHDARLGLVDIWVQFKLWDTKYSSDNKRSTSLPRRCIWSYSYPPTRPPLYAWDVIDRTCKKWYWCYFLNHILSL